LIDQVTVPLWVSVKTETRKKLREIFMVPQSAYTETVVDPFGQSYLVSDGSTNADLQVITVEKLREFLGSAATDETVYDLFKRVVEKLESEEQKTEEPKIEVPVEKLKCDKCEFTTASKFALRMHISRFHK